MWHRSRRIRSGYSCEGDDDGVPLEDCTPTCPEQMSMAHVDLPYYLQRLRRARTYFDMQRLSVFLPRILLLPRACELVAFLTNTVPAAEGGASRAPLAPTAPLCVC